MQMTRIERREARIRRIREQLRMPITGKSKRSSTSGKALKHRYLIGDSEHVYRHIGTFLRSHDGDPAIKVNFVHCVAGRMSVYS